MVMDRFGSGWYWLCVDIDGVLVMSWSCHHEWSEWLRSTVIGDW